MLEDLQLGGLRLLQKKHGFRMGMESVLLADFARIRPEARVADLGTGTGILPLLLWGRHKGRLYDALEANPDMADMAARTVRLNGLEDRIHIIVDGAERVFRHLPANSMDAVVSNPPWIRPGRGPESPDPDRAAAMHQREETMPGFLKAARGLLKGKGRFFLVYPAAFLTDLLPALRAYSLEPRTIRLVYPVAERPAGMALVEAVRDGGPGLAFLPPLVVHTSDGGLTNELKSVYHMQEQTAVSFPNA